MNASGLRIVSGDEAREIAAAYLRERRAPGPCCAADSAMDSPARGVDLAVQDAADMRLNVYGLRVPPRRLWAVIVRRPPSGPRSSVVVLVEKVGGRVVYYGSAGDEG